MLATTCPSRETLLRYSVGLASEEQSNELADHLGSCPDCQATILTLADADDTLIHRLRMPVGSESYLAEPQFQAAVADAIAMPDRGAVEPDSSGTEGRLAAMPQTLGEYQLLEELGRGGMGRVYKALQTKLDRVVAVKVLPRGRMGDQQAITRFEREMKAVGRLAHPNIVQAYDAREIDDTPVLIMEFVDGLDLAEMVRRLGSLPVAEACELVRQTALALQCACEHGLVHRDIKPSNIMLARSGEVKLLDLGLARFYAEGGGSLPPASAGEEMTGTGQAMGTADYMAPEQASDSRTVDIRADLYSLGCTLYKLLSGRAPFSGPGYRSTLDKLNAHVHQPVPPIRDFASDVPEELAAILDRMLAKVPGERYATPAEVAAALEPLCKGANLADLIARAMTIPVSVRDSASESPISERERAAEGSLFLRERVGVREPAPVRRRPLLRRILIGAGFLGALAAGFFAGVVITIKKNGWTYQVDVPENSKIAIDKEGNATVSIPGGPERGRASTTGAAADLKALQGQWKVVRVEKGANADSSWVEIWQSQPSDPATTSRFDFFSGNDGTLRIIRQGAAPPYLQSFRYNLDPTESPKRIDLFQIADALHAEGPGALGIYEIEGEQLKIHLTKRVPVLQEQAQRPKRLSIEPNSGDVLFVLERYRAEDEKKIRGTWAIITEITDGAAVLEQNRRVFEWSLQETDANPRRADEYNGVSQQPFVLVATQDPKRIMLPHLTFDRNSQQYVSEVLNGIYRLDGERLHIAYRPDGPPPEKFESTPGSGVTLLALERPKPPVTPPEVAVVHPIVRLVTPHEDFTVTAKGAQMAEVRARVTGHLAKLLIVRGAMVKQGDVLFEIDSAPFQAEVEKREADVRLAQLQLDRTKKQLKDLKVAAPSDRQRLDASQAATEAALTAAQEQLKVARLNLASTRVTAPISGKIGRNGRPMIPVGRLVTDTMPLATIDSVDPIAFEVYGPNVSRSRRGGGFLGYVGRDPLHPNPKAGLPVLLESNVQEGFVHKGKVETANIPVDPATGTAAPWRALFPNPDGRLIPGMSARARITGDPYEAVLVPNTAVRREHGPSFVFTVTDQNVLHRREIELGGPEDGMWVVKKGLTVDDWVIDKAPTRFLDTWVDGMTVKPLKTLAAAVPPASLQDKPPAKLIDEIKKTARKVTPEEDNADNRVKGQGPPASVPPVVSVSQPVVRDVSDYLDLTGQTGVAKTAEIRARVSGELVKVHIKPGISVKQGDLLMEIDPRLYQAELDQASNVVKQAKIRLDARTDESKRLQELLRNRAVSQAEFDQAKNQRAEAEAALQTAEAALDVARLHLEYTRIVAPFAGKISGPVLDEGNLATADKTALATIASTDPLCLNFQMDERSLLAIRRKGNDKSDPLLSLPVLCGLADDKGYPYRAKMDFVDSHADPATGTISCRAMLANKDGVLMPGLFVRVRLITNPPHKALLVREGAIGSDQGQKYVLVVSDQNVAGHRAVTTGALEDDGMRVVTEGLKAEDWVVTSGLQRVQPGMTVKPLKSAPGSESTPGSGVTVPVLEKPTPAASPKPDEPKSGKSQAPPSSAKNPTADGRV